MNVGLHRTAAAMLTQERHLEAISTNLANVDTPGFKRGISATREFRLPAAGDRRGLTTAHRTDFSQGELRRTGRDLDLALFGAGYFAVEGPRGEVYTRDGTFHVTPDGVLVDGDGSPVAWNERRAPVDPTGLPITVDGDGVVRQDGRRLGVLRIVNFTDPQALVPDGNGNWIAPPELRETTPTAAIHQYALEQSNATGVDEMVALVEVQRAFQTTASVFTNIQESYRRLTRPA